MIRILTDSACDILPAEAQQLGVTVIPLNVTLEDGTVLRDGIDKMPLPPGTKCWASFCPMRCPAPVSAQDLLPTLPTWTMWCS